MPINHFLLKLVVVIWDFEHFARDATTDFVFEKA